MPIWTATVALAVWTKWPAIGYAKRAPVAGSTGSDASRIFVLLAFRLELGRITLYRLTCCWRRHFLDGGVFNCGVHSREHGKKDDLAGSSVMPAVQRLAQIVRDHVHQGPGRRHVGYGVLLAELLQHEHL